MPPERGGGQLPRARLGLANSAVSLAISSQLAASVAAWAAAASASACSVARPRLMVLSAVGGGAHMANGLHAATGDAGSTGTSANERGARGWLAPAAWPLPPGPLAAPRPPRPAPSTPRPPSASPRPTRWPSVVPRWAAAVARRTSATRECEAAAAGCGARRAGATEGRRWAAGPARARTTVLAGAARRAAAAAAAAAAASACRATSTSWISAVISVTIEARSAARLVVCSFMRASDCGRDGDATDGRAGGIAVRGWAAAHRIDRRILLPGEADGRALLLGGGGGKLAAECRVLDAQLFQLRLERRDLLEFLLAPGLLLLKLRPKAREMVHDLVEAQRVDVEHVLDPVLDPLLANTESVQPVSEDVADGVGHDTAEALQEVPHVVRLGAQPARHHDDAGR